VSAEFTQRPEGQAEALLAAVETLVPDLPVPTLLELRGRLVRLEDAVLRRILASPLAPVTAITDQETDDRLLTLSEAAEYLRRSPSWVYHRWRGLRLGFRSGSRLRFRRAVLYRYLRACERRS